MNVRRVLVAAGLLTLLSWQVSWQASAQADDGMPKSPTKKPSPSWEVRMAALTALDGCATAMAAHGSKSALATDDEYFTYTSGRDAAVAKDAAIVAFDASLARSRDRTPSKMFPVCTKYFADYAAGVGAADAPLSTYCEARVRPFLRQATDNLAEFQRQGLKNGRISMARSNLESARFGLRGGQFSGPIGHCSLNDNFKKAMAPMKTVFAALEAQIVAAETAKGIKFVPIDNKDLGTGTSYVDLKTNQPMVGSQ